MGQWHKLTATDGTAVHLALYEPEVPAKAVLFLLPALGVKAGFYKRVAEGLSAVGVTTVLFEQRGHGESTCLPKKDVKVGYSQYLDLDLPLAIKWINGRFSDTPLFIGGHSLGAHFSNFLAAEQAVDIQGIIHMACVFPYYGFYSRREAFLLRFLCMLIPSVTKVLGHYPGRLFGFGGKEHRQVMLDWRDWALTGSYDFGARYGVEQKMATYRGKLLSISFENDELASALALHKPHAVMSGADVSRVHLTQKEQGKHIGHFDWARRPDGVVKTIEDWIDTCLT